MKHDTCIKKIWPGPILRLLVGGEKEELHRRLGLTLPFFCSVGTRRTTTDQNTRKEGRKKAKRYSEGGETNERANLWRQREKDGVIL